MTNSFYTYTRGLVHKIHAQGVEGPSAQPATMPASLIPASGPRPLSSFHVAGAGILGLHHHEPSVSPASLALASGLRLLPSHVAGLGTLPCLHAAGAQTLGSHCWGDTTSDPPWTTMGAFHLCCRVMVNLHISLLLDGMNIKRINRQIRVITTMKKTKKGR
uniref:Uncharacterized protein n=1 Tax=Myotis myotis TaxID=51298 RepID=A0A7J7WWE2_MYOMY|nr:hypothetical protein mMyoMyo1_011926 [Myotis myotis]